MITTILHLAILGFLGEALTELAIKSSLFLPIRQRIVDNAHKLPLSSFIDWSELVTCGYCFSVWVAIILVTIGSFFMVLTYTAGLVLSFLLFVGYVLAVHRVSNLVHGVIDRHFSTKKDIRYQAKN